MRPDENKKRHIVVCGKGGGGEANVQPDWNQSDPTQPDFIKNKPTVYNEWFGTQEEYDLIDPKDPNTTYHIESGGFTQIQSDWNQSDNTQVDYIKNKPTIPAAQVQSDWNANSGMGEILNKPSTETLTFTLQGGTTVTLDVYVAPQLP